ncbi:hypothetical protein [Campylobacter sp. RM16187]|uniref:hypothetical protein n=1 Tax=Campylobacter sp. RM16187 TaxID=1660063 RepID=UPI0021B5F8F0|nr:hypothetical protein [Campylobacter sp. RM16187]QKG30298.1 hypothetical protein CDOMF_a049 [Campylobacter sp. RM16187]
MRLIEIANELKNEAEKILKCELTLDPFNEAMILKEGQGFFPVARFADGIKRRTSNKKFLIYKGKKCFSKKIGKFEYLLEIVDLG